MPLHEETISSLSKKLAAREVSAVELAESVLERISLLNGRLNAYITVTPEVAMEQARRADTLMRSGPQSPLCGIPMAIKDVLTTKGIPTTCASKMLATFVPPYDSTVTKKLRAAGAVIVGKANMDEFAMGSSNETSYFGPCRNPWNLDYVPGGSSGGSACAVAADMCIAAIGTDTGGSIRLPASYCGIVGMKPTYGRVSRYGLVAYASSLDQAGPLTKSVEDCALVLQVVCGYDQRDSTSANIPVPDFSHSLTGNMKGVRIGIPREYFVEGIDRQVEGLVRSAADQFEELGASCVDVSLPHTEYAIPVYYLIATAEASSNLARYDGVRYGYRAQEPFRGLRGMFDATRAEGFGDEVKRRIMLGTYALSSGYYDAYYLKAQQVRTLIRRDFKDAFETCEIILTPTSPTAAFRIGEKVGDPLEMYLIDVFTISANLAGLPAISVPCGHTKEGLPVGLQILARPFDEAAALNAAWAFEQSTDYHTLKPSI